MIIDFVFLSFFLECFEFNDILYRTRAGIIEAIKYEIEILANELKSPHNYHLGKELLWSLQANYKKTVMYIVHGSQ